MKLIFDNYLISDGLLGSGVERRVVPRLLVPLAVVVVAHHVHIVLQ